MKCFNCNEEILGDTYFSCLDNFMQTNYFEYKDERDNIFCSKNCFCEFLTLEEIDNEEIEEMLDEDDYLGWLADEQHEAMMLED